MKTIQHLQQIEATLEKASMPKASAAWGGADVIVTTHRPQLERDPNCFYPDKRYVVTEHALELSWLIEKLFSAFYADQLIDGCSKIEFCGRLANAANRCMGKNPDVSARMLLSAVMHEAFCMYEEMQEGSFVFLPVAIGNTIADDFVDDAERNGYIGIDETARFFKDRGVDLP